MLATYWHPVHTVVGELIKVSLNQRFSGSTSMIELVGLALTGTGGANWSGLYLMPINQTAWFHFGVESYALVNPSALMLSVGQ